MSPSPKPGRRRDAARRLRHGLCLLATLLVMACSSNPAPRGAKAGHTPDLDRQLMVTLAKAPRALLERTVSALAVEHGLRPVAAWDMATLDVRCVVFEAASATELPRTLRRLSKDPRVDLAQPVQVFRTRGDGSGDPYRHLQHGADSLRLEDIHRHATGRGIKIAIIDTGIDIGHPDLEGRVILARNFVRHDPRRFADDMHGTAVAGIIAALADNGEGIRGVAPEAEIMALKACWYAAKEEPGQGALCDSYSLAQALDFAVAEGARVLNLSLGGPEDPLLRQLLETALGRGVVVTAADGDNDDGTASFPASMDQVLAVRSWSRPSDIAPSTPTGDTSAGREPCPHGLYAPGQEILTTVPGGSYDFLSGASLATAHISGVSALLLQHLPNLDPPHLMQLLQATANRPDDAPRVDACAAIARALKIPSPCPSPAPEAPSP